MNKDMDKISQLIILISFYSDVLDRYSDILDLLVRQLGREGGEEIEEEELDGEGDDDIWADD